MPRWGHDRRMLDLGCWLRDALRAAFLIKNQYPIHLRHTSGEAAGGYRNLVTVSWLFFGQERRIDGWRGAGFLFSDRNQGGVGLLDRFYADNFGARRAFGALDGG